MSRDYIRDNYGSHRGFLHYYLDASRIAIGLYRQELPPVSEIARVIFVCQGNICRSALAEAVFERNSTLQTVSLGLNTTSGKPANPRLMKVVLDRAALDLSEHRTTSIDNYRPQLGDLFVCMEIQQIRKLRKHGYEGPMVLLGQFGEKSRARINDPYTANDDYMAKAVKDIIYHTNELAKMLQT